jgi:phosphoglycolate phosphatase-like HAD superfamily hydrolase
MMKTEITFCLSRSTDLSASEKDRNDNCALGDTPRDVECAHIYGALCIGVATGPYLLKL